MGSALDLTFPVIRWPTAEDDRHSDGALFRAIADHPALGVAILEAPGVVTANSALVAMLGTAGSQHDSAYAQLFTDIRAGERALKRTDGSTLWALVTPVIAGDRQLCLVADITPLKSTSETLARAEARYRQLVEEAVEGVFQSSPDGRFLWANPALARMYGYDSVADLLDGVTDIGTQLYAQPGRRDEFVRLIADEGSVNGFVSQVSRRDGAVIWVSEKCRAVRDDQGRTLHYEGMVEEITDRKRLEERLFHDATHDALTGLPNRVLFSDRLAKAMQRSRRRHGNFAVLFIDCDRFKQINDSLGHLAGDQLLVQMAERIQTCLRASDTLARLGGDEFAVLAEDIDGSGHAEGIAERIRDRYAEPFILDGVPYYLSTSIGIATSRPDYRRPEEVLRDADTAMYEAKNLGRNRHVLFSDGMRLMVVDRLRAGNDLRRALEQKEFFVEYQPIVQIGSGRLVGFEALVRWRHPDRGRIMPDAFLGIAEENGLIHAIGCQVLADAAGQLAAWRREKPEQAGHLFVAVNMAPSQLLRPDIVDDVLAIVEQAGIEPDSIHLELTESGMMSRPAEIKEKLGRFRELGFKLAIDDFGTGHSSLAHLHLFPIDTLKIDRSFIAPLLLGGVHFELVRTILTLGRTLGMNVVAEGIETLDHDAVLSEMNCTYGQGWHYGKPLASAEAEARIAAPVRRQWSDRINMGL